MDDYFLIVVSIILIYIPKALEGYLSSKIRERFSRLINHIATKDEIINVTFESTALVGFLGAYLSLILSSIVALKPLPEPFFDIQKGILLIGFIVFYLVLLGLLIRSGRGTLLRDNLKFRFLKRFTYSQVAKFMLVTGNIGLFLIISIQKIILLYKIS